MSKVQQLFEKLPNRIKDADIWATDADTGETTVLPVYLQKPKNKKFQENWLVLWQDDAEDTGMSILEQAADKRLTVTDFRVRDYLLCKAGMFNDVHISHSEASKYLGIARPNISASIKRLIEFGIVIQGQSKGRFKTYRMNPAMVYKGKIEIGAQERKDAIKDAKAKVLQFQPLKQGSLVEAPERL